MSTIKELAETCGVHYGKDEGNQVAKPTTTSCETCETSCETNETMKEIIEILRKDLEAKDKQIESLQNSLDRTTAALVSAQESIKAAQLLQANSEQKLKMIEKPAEEAERPRRKHWWQRWGD